MRGAAAPLGGGAARRGVHRRADPPALRGRAARWFSDGIAHVLTLLDRGPEVRDLDPEVEAVYGANISFRVEPLKRAGGFDPALGHSGRRVFFAEEDEAQRALARLGYAIRYVPDAAVEHVIPAERLTRALVRAPPLRLRAGAWAARRAPARARRAAGAQVGVPERSRRRCAGERALAMERAVRAAENAGVLAARRPSRAR